MPRNVWILSGIALGVAIGYGVVNPVLPLFAASFGVNAFAAAAVVSAFALMRLVFAPAVGRLADRFGHRAVLISGVLMVAASSVGAGFAGSYVQLIALRGAGGIGSAMFSVSAMTVLLASVGPDRRGRASALFQGGFLVGAVSGPAIGGLFAAISLRAPFFFYSFTLVVAAAVALGLVDVGGFTVSRSGPAPLTSDDAAAPPSGPKPLRVVAADRRYQAALLAHLAQGWNTNGARGALVPLFVAAYLVADPAQAALWSGVAMSVAGGVQMVAIWPAGWVVDRFGRRIPMIGGAAVAGLAMAALPFSRTFALMTALLAVYALGAAALGTAPAAAVGDVAGPGATRPIALYSMAGDAGAVLGPLVA
ncbi:MAG: MFS transporter, partial [Bifidobacteriaceae bacterium]|nr:MFS transporter [Bifidobacteriaceae bacterium]